jgi:hypothetical protein
VAFIPRRAWLSAAIGAEPPVGGSSSVRASVRVCRPVQFLHSWQVAPTTTPPADSIFWVPAKIAEPEPASLGVLARQRETNGILRRKPHSTCTHSLGTGSVEHCIGELDWPDPHTPIRSPLRPADHPGGRVSRRFSKSVMPYPHFDACQIWRKASRRVSALDQGKLQRRAGTDGHAELWPLLRLAVPASTAQCTRPQRLVLRYKCIEVVFSRLV